jgi:hypothetical protein
MIKEILTKGVIKVAKKPSLIKSPAEGKPKPKLTRSNTTVKNILKLFKEEGKNI